MNRITRNDLDKLVASLNEKEGITTPKYNVVGSYELNYACGGVELVKIVNDGGGCESVSNRGLGTKRALYEFMQGMLA